MLGAVGSRQQRASRSSALTSGVIPVFGAQMPLIYRMPPARDITGSDDIGGAFGRAGCIADHPIVQTQTRAFQPVGGRSDTQTDDDDIGRNLRTIGESNRFNLPVADECLDAHAEA